MQWNYFKSVLVPAVFVVVVVVRMCAIKPKTLLKGAHTNCVTVVLGSDVHPSVSR